MCEIVLFLTSYLECEISRATINLFSHDFHFISDKTEYLYTHSTKI